MGKLKSCVSVILLLSANAFAGEIYKWTDENGKIHFGDKSNAPKQSQEVIVKPVTGTGSMPTKYDFTTKEQPKTTAANTKRSNTIDLESPADTNTLYGDDGNDTLVGGEYQDSLFGGADATATNNHQITLYKLAA